MKYRNLKLALLSLGISALTLGQGELATDIKFNKLREMYNFYYLPFNLQFKVGEQTDDVFPVVDVANGELGKLSKTIAPDDMTKIETSWKQVRNDWKKKSLFLNTNLEVGKKTRISPHLVSHKIAVTTTALDNLNFSTKLVFQKSLQNQSPEIQTNVTQLFFLKSFLDERDQKNFNFFIFSPSWCASSQEYRAIFEAYYKTFSPEKLTIHSVVIEDPKEAIFDSKIFKELFPHANNYSHEIVPRFLAVEEKEGKSIVYEEGEALAILYERFFKEHQGFLNKMANGIIPDKLLPSAPKTSSAIAISSKMAQ